MTVAATVQGVQVAIFDAYGTLFDVHSAVQRHAAAMGPQAQGFSDLWRAKQLEYTWILTLSGQYRDFWQLTQEALDYAFLRFPGIDPALRQPLLDAYRTLEAYPEAAAVLDRLRQSGLSAGILSNGEPTMLADAARSAGLDTRLDVILSVDVVRQFKTTPATYQLVLNHFGFAPHQVLFVSSNRWDVAGAAAFGFVPVWVNRSGLPPEYPGLDPVATVPDLNGVG